MAMCLSSRWAPGPRPGAGHCRRTAAAHARRADPVAPECRARQARNKNPDEFYFAMLNAKTKGGKHVLAREGVQYTAEEMKLLRTQDLTYINMSRAKERSQIERLRADLHLLVDLDDDDDGDGDGPAVPDGLRNEHVVFVDSQRQLDRFDPVAHFDTVPELINRKYNRPTVATLKATAVAAPDSAAELDTLDRKSGAGYLELERRIVRLAQLDKLANTMQTQRDLQGKGRRKKVRGADGQPPVYKWKKQRKR